MKQKFHYIPLMGGRSTVKGHGRFVSQKTFGELWTCTVSVTIVAYPVITRVISAVIVNSWHDVITHRMPYNGRWHRYDCLSLFMSVVCCTQRHRLLCQYLAITYILIFRSYIYFNIIDPFLVFRFGMQHSVSWQRRLYVLPQSYKQNAPINDGIHYRQTSLFNNIINKCNAFRTLKNIIMH
jgi:hypothetical protein